jgi:autophagy-related protein 16
LAETSDELKAHKARLAETEQLLKESEELTEAQKKTIEVLNAELSRFKEAQDLSLKELSRLKSENSALVQQLLLVKEEQIEKMNELNEYYESIMRHARHLEEARPVPDLGSAESLSQSSIRAVRVPTSQRQRIMAHNEEANAVVYNDGGELLFTAGSDNCIKVWEANTGRETKVLRGLTHTALCLAVSTGTEMVLAGTTNKTALLWNYFTQRVRHTFTGHSNKVVACQFFNSKSMVASRQAVTGGADRCLKLWDVDKGFCTKTMLSHSGVLDISLSPEDSYLASAHFDGHLRLWSPRTAEMLNDITISERELVCCAVSPSSTRVLVLGKDNAIRVLDMRTLEVMGTLTQSQFNVRSTTRACWSTDSRFIVAGSDDGSVHIWDANTFQVKTRQIEDVKTGVHTNPIKAACWRPRANQFATVDSVGGLVIWE